MNIVEHVANVVDNIVFQPGLNTHAQSHRIARAAIIATLQYLRDNPSKRMIEDGNWAIDECIDSWNYDSGSGYCVEQRAAAETLRAMLTALIEEIEGA